MQTIPLAGDYRIDQAQISFTTRHMFGLGKVRGSFQMREGHVYIAHPVEGSVARATIAASSIDTGNSTRDSVVREQYLDASGHPDIVFASTGLAEDGDHWILRGRLTVRGRTAPLDLRIGAVREEGPRVHFTATCVVDRYEFGITKMRGMTGRRLTFELEVTATSST